MKTPPASRPPISKIIVVEIPLLPPLMNCVVVFTLFPNRVAPVAAELELLNDAEIGGINYFFKR